MSPSILIFANRHNNSIYAFVWNYKHTLTRRVRLKVDGTTFMYFKHSTAKYKSNSEFPKAANYRNATPVSQMILRICLRTA